MATALYITHSEVVIDPNALPTQWELSDDGRARMERFAARNMLPADTRIFSSPERKTAETAAILATQVGGDIIFDPGLCENWRPTMGLLSSKALEGRLQALYAQPDVSSGDWEAAEATLERVTAAVREAREQAWDHTLVFVGHGTSGTLLKCHLGGRTLDRSEDQRLVAHPGGGNLFVFDLAEWRLLCDWTAIEDWKGFGP